MRKSPHASLLTVPLVLSLCPLVASSQPLMHVWSMRFGDADTQSANHIAADPSGNVIVSGGFWGTVDFGGGPFTNAGNADGFLVKFNPNRWQIWTKRFVDCGIPDIAVDLAGNIVGTGGLSTDVDFGGGPLNAQDGALFLVKFGPNGQHLWSKPYAVGGSVISQHIAVDALGDIFVAGSFAGTVDFGGGPLTGEGGDVFLVKFDPLGNHLWSKRFGGAHYQVAHSVAADAAGNVIIGGAYEFTIDFGGGPLTIGDTFDAFIAKFDPSGTHMWSKNDGLTGVAEGASSGAAWVATDALNNVFWAGSFRGTINLGGGPLVSAGEGDIMLAKLDANGSHLWSKRFGDAGSQGLAGVAADPFGNVIITGSGVADFGGGPTTGAGQMYLAKFSANGSHISTTMFAGTNSVVAADNSGNALLTGYFTGTIDFGGGSMAAAGDDDIYVAKFGELPVATAIVSFGARDSERGVMLSARIRSDLSIQSVRVYRGSSKNGDQLVLIDTERDVRGNAFEYIDRAVTPGQTYRYRIGVVDPDGEFFSPIETVSLKTLAASLAQNVPNPFNPQTTITYTVVAHSAVAIEIFNASGALVRRLDQGVREAGSYSVEWDGRDATNREVGSGVYFYRLSGFNATETRKMVLVK